MSCTNTLKQQEEVLCTHCQSKLVSTNHSIENSNKVFQQFTGRIEIDHALSAFYFQKNNALQHVLHGLKYANRKDAGLYLGKLLGEQLASTSWANDIDCIIPLPLHPKKQQKRGYNQAEIIAEGVQEATNLPIDTSSVKRVVENPSQITQGRFGRWDNVSGIFEITKPLPDGYHVLLIDDVITTGSTIEACAVPLLSANCKVSIASIATALAQ
jgi:ComF family protein